MDYGPIPPGARYAYTCEACGEARAGTLDHPGYDWRCPRCGGRPRVEEVQDGA